MTALANVDRALGDQAPLPRDNGELVFEEPWQGRALGMGVVVLERIGAPWPEFRRHLAAAIAARGEPAGESVATTYYSAWLDALEALLAERGLLAYGSDQPARAGSGSSATGSGGAAGSA
jgi:nitrile hydratase accessory protein